LRIVGLARLGVAAVIYIAHNVSAAPKWPQFSFVLWIYTFAAIAAAVLLFTRWAPHLMSARMQLAFAAADVIAIFVFKIAAPDGTYAPLLVMMLLPIMVVLDVSWQRAAVALTVIAVTFAIEVYTDHVFLSEAGYGRVTLATLIFVFLCCTTWLAVYAQARQLNEIEKLSASRRELLVDLMTASDEQQRTISEYLHDGPLQSVLMARQDIMSVLKKQPSDALERALAGLRDATDQMREATFELHPAVLAGAGLARAVTQLAAANSSRSGIDISTDIDYPQPSSADAIVYGVARELLSNVVRHSRATRASISLKAVEGECRLDVIDDGIGVAPNVATERLAQGHIGLASQRTRIEAAGGTMQVREVPSGTHIVVTVPLVNAE
jgi:two-component system NarL family sensor kinase